MNNIPKPSQAFSLRNLRIFLGKEYNSLPVARVRTGNKYRYIYGDETPEQIADIFKKHGNHIYFRDQASKSNKFVKSPAWDWDKTKGKE